MPLKLSTSHVEGDAVLFGVPIHAMAESERHALEVSISTTPGNDHPFFSVHKSITGSIIDTLVPTADHNFTAMPSALYNQSASFLEGDFPPASAMVRLLAHTNPATPQMNLPNILWELRDLPDMIRQGGRIADAIRRRRPWKKLIRPGSILRDTASANLALQFGWLPFLSDMWAIANLQPKIDRTKEKLNKLHSGKGLRAGMSFGSRSEKSTANVTLWSVGGIFIEAPMEITRTTSMWGIAKWKPQATSSLPNSDAEFTRRALGLTIDSITINVWESLPWSWLIDYFTDVGSLLKAGNHAIAIPISGCVMTKSEFLGTHIATTGNHACSGGTFRAWTHARGTINDVASSPIDFLGRIPVLTGAQLSTLGSLAVARAR